MEVTPRASTVADGVVQIAIDRPNTPAVVDTNGFSITYAALVADARTIADQLVEDGVEPGELVGVCHRRGADAVVAMLAVSLAGGVYVPVSPDDPPARTEHLLDHVGVRAVLQQRGDGDGLRLRPVPRPTILAPIGDEDAADCFAGNCVDDRPLCVLFTSGSAGTPKAVVIAHRAVWRLADDHEFIDLQHNDRVGFASHPMFDAATWEVWATLLNGATIVTLAPQDLLDTELLRRALVGRRITRLLLTTSLFDSHARRDPRMFGSLTSLAVGGEPLDPATIRSVLYSGAAPKELLNAYGPTETTTFAAWHRIETVAADAVRIPIGRPVAETMLEVVDEHGHRCPPGATGELWIGGAGVALGYLHDGDFATERFVTTSIDDGPFERWHRSGDLATIDDNGLVDWLGRMDGQVKIRGARVDPAEIEAALVATGRVSAAAVIAIEAGDHQRLVAYVVPIARHAPDDEIDKVAIDKVAIDAAPDEVAQRVLLDLLREQLPTYMVPAQVVTLAKLPLTANGKVDRAALPTASVIDVGDVFGEATAVDDELDPYQGLAVVGWERVLGHDRFGEDDDFFDVGGDSLAATELLSWLTDTMSASTRAMSSLLGSPQPLTLRRTAALLAKVAARERNARLPAIIAAGHPGDRSCFIVPGADGSAFGVRWLMGQMVSSWHVMTGTEAGHDGTARRPRSIRARATRWIADLDRAGHLPIDVIAGFSSGAVIAHEISIQLERQGRPPRTLVLIDPPSPPASLPARRRVSHRLRAMTRHRRSLRWVHHRLLHTAAPLEVSVAVAIREVELQLTRHVVRATTVPTHVVVAAKRFKQANRIVREWATFTGPTSHSVVIGAHSGPDGVIRRRRAADTAKAIGTALAIAASAHDDPSALSKQGSTEAA